MSSAIAHKTAESGFDHFSLDSKLTRGLEAAGFSDPRPIQVETIPACLEGRDVMGLAQTGTGKTAAFALPILQRLIGLSSKANRMDEAITIYRKVVETEPDSPTAHRFLADALRATGARAGGKRRATAMRRPHWPRRRRHM